MTKLLIFIPSPRDIREFKDAIEKLPHDKLWVKYLHYRNEPYQKARTFFLNHKEYTHFAICPDDLIPTVEGVEQLWKDAQTLSFIAGICNVDMEDMGKVAATLRAPSVVREGRRFDWIRSTDLKGFDSNIVKVGWCGTPFAILNRKLMEQIEFRGDLHWNPFADKTESFDIQIAHDLKELGVDEYIDTRVFFKHRRHGGQIMVGRKHPYYLWITKDEEKKTWIRGTGMIKEQREPDFEPRDEKDGIVCGKCRKPIYTMLGKWLHKEPRHEVRCGRPVHGV